MRPSKAHFRHTSHSSSQELILKREGLLCRHFDWYIREEHVILSRSVEKRILLLFDSQIWTRMDDIQVDRDNMRKASSIDCPLFIAIDCRLIPRKAWELSGGEERSSEMVHADDHSAEGLRWAHAGNVPKLSSKHEHSDDLLSILVVRKVETLYCSRVQMLGIKI